MNDTEQHLIKALDAISVEQHDGPMSIVAINPDRDTMLDMVLACRKKALGGTRMFFGTDDLAWITFLRLKYPMYEYFTFHGGGCVFLAFDSVFLVHVNDPAPEQFMGTWASLKRGGVLSVCGTEEETTRKRLNAFLVDTLKNPVYPQNLFTGHFFVKKGKE